MTEDELAGWHCWPYGHESEQTLGVGDGQGRLACCSLWGHKELDTTEQLNYNNYGNSQAETSNIEVHMQTHKGTLSLINNLQQCLIPSALQESEASRLHHSPEEFQGSHCTFRLLAYHLAAMSHLWPSIFKLRYIKIKNVFLSL